MNTKFVLLLLSLLGLNACESSPSGNSSSGYDNQLTGTWIEVKGMQGPDNRDTVSFSPDTIDLNTISTLHKFAEQGQIWEDFGGDKIYKYAYKVVDDTLWMMEYDSFITETAQPFNKLWANAYVKLASYTPPPAVDPDLIGNWIEASNDFYTDSLVVSQNRFEFHKARSDLFEPILYGVDGPVFVKEGIIGETINGIDEIHYAYRLVGDTLYLNACSSFCSEFSPDFLPGQEYVRLSK